MGTTGSWAYEGMPFPVVAGFDYKRDPNGRVVLSDLITGYPAQNSDSLVVFGQAQPTTGLVLTGFLTIKSLLSRSFLNTEAGQ